MSVLSNAPAPTQDPIATPHRYTPEYRNRPSPSEGMLSTTWELWVSQLTLTVASAIASLHSTTVTSQAASIGPTDISGGALLSGLYRVSWYAQITTAAGVSSSLTVSFGWTRNAVSQSFSGPALTTNTTASNQSGTIVVKVDPRSPLTYSTAYVSVGAPAMVYEIDVLLERLPA